LFGKISNPDEHLKNKSSQEKSFFRSNNNFENHMKMNNRPFFKNINEPKRVKSFFNSENLKKEEKNEIFVKIEQNNSKIKNFFEELTTFKPIKKKYLSFIQYVQGLESQMADSKTKMLHSETNFLIESTQDVKNYQEYEEQSRFNQDSFFNHPRNFGNNNNQIKKKQKKTSFLSVVSGLNEGKIHKEVLNLDYFVDKSFLAKSANFLLVKSLKNQFYLYDIQKSDENKTIFYPKLKENNEFNKMLNNCQKAEFIQNKNKEKLLFVSDKNELTLCDLESNLLNPICIEKDVIEFTCVNQTDILVLKKNLQIKNFDLKSDEFKKQSSNDPNEIKQFLYTLIYDENFQESNL
jgi:hypothetical protein